MADTKILEHELYIKSGEEWVLEDSGDLDLMLAKFVNILSKKCEGVKLTFDGKEIARYGGYSLDDPPPPDPTKRLAPGQLCYLEWGGVSAVIHVEAAFIDPCKSDVIKVHYQGFSVAPPEGLDITKLVKIDQPHFFLHECRMASKINSKPYITQTRADDEQGMNVATRLIKEGLIDQLIVDFVAYY